MADQFTRLLAYMGDERALDGYTNITPISESADIQQFVENVKEIFARMEAIPEGVRGKVVELLNTSYNTNPEEKAELIEYIEEFDASQGMMGGKRKRARKSRKARRKRL